MESESKQERPQCTCDWLHDAAVNPEMPIKFNPEMNEFELHAARAIWAIHYCPACGGRVPESLRDTFFAIITPEEEQRLNRLAEGITSPEDALRVFGPPDRDRHTLTYRNLSETAYVVAIVDNGEWRGVFQQRKNIRPQTSNHDTGNA